MGAPGSLNPAQKLTNKMPERRRAEGEGRGEAGHGVGLREQTGAREGGNPRVESGGQGPTQGKGGAGAKGAQRRRWQGTQPQEIAPPPPPR